jgi:hypothetical protein
MAGGPGTKAPDRKSKAFSILSGLRRATAVRAGRAGVWGLVFLLPEPEIPDLRTVVSQVLNDALVCWDIANVAFAKKAAFGRDHDEWVVAITVWRKIEDF